jgi:probable F420-dependent oxidoreductase
MSTTDTILGRVGVWQRDTDWAAEPDLPGTAAELDELGLTAAWIGGSTPDSLYRLADALLGGSGRLAVASGILNIRIFAPDETFAALAALEKAHPGRFVTGLGVSHPEFARYLGAEYTAPLPAMRAWLDAMDAAPGQPPTRVLAALGPRMLGLARDRANGAHPYFTTPGHTRRAREVLGEGPLLAPEQKVLLETDPERARAIVRAASGRYFAMTNYARNLRDLGFTEEDLADGGSDRLVDALVAWGDEETIAARVREHLDAGADHVAVQVMTAGDGPARLPREEWRRIAPVLREL